MTICHAPFYFTDKYLCVAIIFYVKLLVAGHEV